VHARKRRPKAISQAESEPGHAGDLKKITRLLALLVVKGESQNDKIKVLSGAGFSNTEVADLLGITANAVNIALYRHRARR
jgi:hypothetical protein